MKLCIFHAADKLLANDFQDLEIVNVDDPNSPECEKCNEEDESESREVVALLADGWTLRSGLYKPDDPASLGLSGEYVRLCDPDGNEYAYWDQEEWREDPALVMGAIINSAAGLRIFERET